MMAGMIIAARRPILSASQPHSALERKVTRLAATPIWPIAPGDIFRSTCRCVANSTVTE